MEGHRQKMTLGEDSDKQLLPALGSEELPLWRWSWQQ